MQTKQWSRKQIFVASLSFVTLLSGVLVAFGLLTFPKYQEWGNYQSPHIEKPPLPFSASIGYTQTAYLEGRAIDGFLLKFTESPPEAGTVTLTVEHEGATTSINESTTSINSEGFLLFEFDPVDIKNDHPTKFTIVTNLKDRFGLAYQIDSTKYPQGSLERFYPEREEYKEIQGNLAFAPRLQTTALSRLFSAHAFIILIFAIVIAWTVLLWYWQSISTSTSTPFLFSWSWVDVLAILGIVIASIPAYWPFLSNIGNYYTNTDYQKDVLYAYSAQESLKDGAMPYWHHYTCGGQPLLGNAETNTLSIVPILSLIAAPYHALNITIALEVGLGAAGVYVLSRWLGLSPVAATLPSLIFILHGFIPNRLWLGHSMYVGGLALAPWVIFSFLRAIEHWKWLVIGGVFGALMLGRGDTHIIFYTFLSLFVVALIKLVAHKQGKPLIALAIMTLIVFLLATPKIFPVLEGQEHFHGQKLPKHVALLWEKSAFDDLLLLKSPDAGKMKVEHGELEQWENIGNYLGLVPILLGFLGLLFMPKGFKLTFFLVIIFFFILAEGTFYNDFLRRIPIVSSLMRLPSRSIWVAVLFLGISGGFAIQWIVHRWRKIGLAISASLLLFILFDLSSYTHAKLNQMNWSEIITAESTANRVGFANAAQPDKQFLSLASAGRVIRGSCPDFNASPPFSLTKERPLVATIDGFGNYVEIPASLDSNEISFTAPTNYQEFIVQSVPSPMLFLSNAVILPDHSEGLHIMRVSSDKPVVLAYRSATFTAGVFIWLGTILALIALLLNSKRSSSSPTKV